ncbi:MAG: class GN sortase [Rhodospirillaceae bacterium]|nr:class GN sortase [Rhodospirillaceae bacterium]|tara:strand:+ start:7113 stop:7706 length:594 start_codon:yes stop_codon:yes gene_type:complete
MRRSKLLVAGALLFGALGAWQLIDGGWIYAKAALAKGMIADAWAETISTGVKIKPWPWADTWPVAKLHFPTHKRDITVLAGAQGATLAFGPGHLDGTSPPGTPGNSVIAGHRDTSFTLLGDLKPGDPIDLQNDEGFWFSYRVAGSTIVDSREQWFPPETGTGDSMLTLVTCWPLDSIVPGGPMRYLVFAEESGGNHR